MVAVFPIRTYPDPVLRLPANRVIGNGAELRRLVDDMFETMYAAPGVGLAAPQIGVALRVIVFDAGEGAHHVLNPVIEETFGEYVYEEGCLSVPDRYWPTARPAPPPGKGSRGERGGRVEQPERAAEIGPLVADADVAVVAAFGRLIPGPVLAVPPAGFVNVHFSLLPRWRGASPVVRALLAGDGATGVTLLQLDAGLAPGPTYG